MRWFLLLLVACGGDGDQASADDVDTTVDTVDTGPVDALCDDAPAVTWENFGAGFVTESCQACHASTSTNRQGAPEAVVFDEEDDVWDRADRVLDRVVERADMPPGGGLSDDDRALVELWLRCD